MGWLPALGVVRFWITAAPAEPEVRGGCAPEQGWRLPGVWQVPLAVLSFAGQQGLAGAPWHCPPWTAWSLAGKRGQGSTSGIAWHPDPAVPGLCAMPHWHQCVSGLSLYWCDGETLDLQNKPHQGGAVLCWVPVLGSHMVRVKPCSLPMPGLRICFLLWPSLGWLLH